MTLKVPMILDKHPDRPQSGLKAIGYWSQKDPPKGGDGLGLAMYVANNMVRGPFPDPKHYVDESWEAWERETVANSVRWKRPEGPGAVRVLARWRGSSWCRFECGERGMGSVCLTDGVYVWPEGFGHYIEKHHVRPPQEFLEHVLDMIERRDPRYQAMLTEAIDDARKVIKENREPVKDMRKWLEEVTGVDLDEAQTKTARDMQEADEKAKK